MFRPDRRRASARSAPRSLAFALLTSLFLLVAPSASPAATLSAGLFHACAVTTTGTVSCWGEGEKGQLGDGRAAQSSTPVTVTGISDATEIAVGSGHSCALRAGGTVKCWGFNGLGSLGNGTETDSAAPLTVPGLTGVVAIATADYTTCALSASGAITCWGQFMPGRDLQGMAEWNSTPTTLGYLPSSTDLAVADGEICGINATATRCFGYWIDRGDGSATYTRAPVELANSSAIQARVGASVWGGCSLLASGQVSCEGYNAHGTLGNGVTGNAWGSDRMPRGHSLALGITDAVAIARVGEGACALITGGQVRCWGPTHNGIPGLGGPDAQLNPTPTPRTDLGTVRAIAGDGDFGCVVDETDAVRCWGANWAGQLGNGTLSPSATASVVAGVRVKRSVRDGVTPVRKGEPDITVGAPGAGPAPTTPQGTTPQSTTPQSTTPGGQFAGFKPGNSLAPVLSITGRTVRVTGFRVPSAPRGCPRTAWVQIKSGKRSVVKTLSVIEIPTGGCEISGVIRLTARLAKAKRFTVTVRPRGGNRIVKRVRAN